LISLSKQHVLAIHGHHQVLSVPIKAGPILPRSPTEGPTYQPLHGRRM